MANISCVYENKHTERIITEEKSNAITQQSRHSPTRVPEMLHCICNHFFEGMKTSFQQALLMKEIICKHVTRIKVSHEINRGNEY